MGEEKSVLRVGGLAGVLAGVFLVISLITFVLSLPPADLEQALATFPENRTLRNVVADLALVGLLLFLPFLAALYGSLREPSRVFARIGLGSGVLATVLLIIAVAGTLQATDAFSALYDRSAIADQPVVVAAFAAVKTLLTAGRSAGYLFYGLAFVTFGLAMRGSRDFGEGLAWLSIVLGIIIVLFVFSVPSWPSGMILVFALVLGWKVYTLSKAA